MPRLAPLKAGEVIRKLRALGFEGPIPDGRHIHMVHHAQKKIIPIPLHRNKDIGIGLLRKIIRETGLDSRRVAGFVTLALQPCSQRSDSLLSWRELLPALLRQ